MTMTLNEFMQKIQQRPLPLNTAARIRTLAKELAEGALEEVWDTSFEVYQEQLEHTAWSLGTTSRFKPRNLRVLEYLKMRWGGDSGCPDFDLLQRFQYLDSGFGLTPLAFQLIDQAQAATIFISYKRDESSAFGLLILTKMKIHNLEPFLDVSLIPGEDWHAGLKERIQQCDSFILLIGKTTLESQYVLKEIGWASNAKRTIIPIWHNGFEFKIQDWDLAPEVTTLLSNTQTIRVLEESASGYEKAIIELLNRFGITP